MSGNSPNDYISSKLKGGWLYQGSSGQTFTCTMSGVVTFFTVSSTSSQGGIFNLDMSSYGSVITMTDVNIQYISAGTNGGVFAVGGTTTGITATNLYAYQPRANGGDGGMFYLTNTGTSSIILTTSNIYNAGASNNGGIVKLAGTTSLVNFITCYIYNTYAGNGNGGIIKADSTS
jgi:hypothetical protein